MLAYRITDWDDRYEVNKDGKPWREDQERRKTGLEYVRCPVKALTWGEGWRELLEAAGAEADRVFGLFIKLLEVAAIRAAGERGWILTGNGETMGPVGLAKKLGFDPQRVLFSLGILIEKVGWIELAECPFALEGNESVKLDGARMAETAALAEKSQRWRPAPALAIASERNRNVTTTETKSELNPAWPAAAGGGEAAGATKGAGAAPGPFAPQAEQTSGLPPRVPEEYETKTVNERRGNEDRAGEVSNSSAKPVTMRTRDEARANENESRAGDAGRQGAKGPINQKSTLGEPLARNTRGGSMEGGLLPWDVTLVDVFGEDPMKCLLLGLSDNPRYAREQVIDRAMGWFKRMLPQLEPPLGSSDLVQKAARNDAACIENRLVEAWDTTGNGELICILIAEMQQILRNLKKRGDRGRGQNNVMAIWVKCSCKQRHRLGLKPLGTAQPP